MSKKKERPVPVLPGRNHVRLELDDEHHAELRVLAAQAGMSMAAYARVVMVKAISDARQKAAKREQKGKGA